MSMIGNEFSGLPMDQLIGAPLKAACDAQISLARASADFINMIGFTPELGTDNKPNGKVAPRQVEFSFWKPVPIDSTKVVIPEVSAKGSITFTAAKEDNEVKSIKVGNTELLGKSVKAKKELADTVKEVAQEINSFNKFTAIAEGSKITITAPLGTGKSLNKIEIKVDSDTDIKYETENMDDGVDSSTVEGNGQAQVQQVILSVPFLSIVNIPSLMVKTVDITFDMEVKSSESHRDESTEELAVDGFGKVGYGPFSAGVKLHGAVSAHQENTRSTDRSAKYHVSVQARDDGMPEGLSRVLDMLQKSISPVSISKPVPLNEAKIAQNQKAIA